MNGHAHEFPPHGVLPDAICPGIEVLVHRRATELVPERPRRRVAALSSVGGVAVAAICAVLVLVIGSPSGGGLLSPRQAVAAVVESLDGDGILHWVREGNLVESPDQAARPGTIVEEEWTDLATGDSHLVATRTSSDAQPQTRVTWRTSDARWFSLSPGANTALTIQRDHLAQGQGTLTAVDEVRGILQRAEQGLSEIAAGGEDRGRPLVVVTERHDQDTRRVWITRDGDPEVVRSETTSATRNAAQPIVTTTKTKTWRILPRTPEALSEVGIPTNAKRVP